MTKFFVDHNSGRLYLRPDRLARHLGLLAVLCLLAGGLGFEQHAAAQSDTGLWTAPVNISKSGGASQPAIAAAPDGTLHALWWDSTLGEMYAQTLSDLSWTMPISVTQIYGQRKTIIDLDTGKPKLFLAPPADLRVVSDSQGKVYALWRDNQNQLFSAQGQSGGWGSANLLTDAVIKVEAMADTQGTVHVAYLRSQNSANAPSGVFYRSAAAGKWLAPSLVYASLYFRTVTAEAAHISLAADGAGRVVIAWEDPEVGQSVYARSSDSGHTWSAPQLVSGSQAGQAIQAVVAATPNGDFFLISQEPGAVGCQLLWRRSADGGETWAEAGSLYNDIGTCPQRFRFPLGSAGPSWLLGMLSPRQTADSRDRMALISWQGSQWSRSVEVNLDFKYPNLANKELQLNDLDLAMAGQSLDVFGTDGAGDIWVARNAVAPDKLVPALVPVWDLPKVVSDQERPVQVKNPPALVADAQGRLYALWSETTASLEPGSALYLAVKDFGRWSRAVRLSLSDGSPAGAAPSTSSGGLAEEPALALDDESRLHAVWRGGAHGEILHCWAFTRDVTSASAWTQSIALPMPGRPGSSPDLAFDPISHTLHVVFAVPYNEGRGIYDVTSKDGGASWSTPTVVFDAAAAKDDSVDKPRLVVDTAARVLHAVWLQAGLIGEPYGRAVMYAQSTDGGRSWSQASVRAVARPDWPRLAMAGPNVVYVVWNQASTSAIAGVAAFEVWGQFSSDGGQHWTDPKRIQGFDVTGAVDLVSDSTGGLYLVGLGQSASRAAMLIFSHWDGQAWSKPETSDLGYDAASGNAATAVFLPASRRLDAALQAFTGILGSVGQFRLVVTGRQVQAVPVAQPSPAPAALPSPTVARTSVPLATATVGAASSLNVINAVQPANPNLLPISNTIMAGVALIVLLVAGLVLFNLIRMARR